MTKAELPLVSVICLCYNHRDFVTEAIDSVLAQTYPRIELIVVDDASTDNSVAVIRQHLLRYPQVKLLALEHNLGNCRAFNRGWRLSRGQYVIDLAADDRLLPERVARGVSCLQAAGPQYGLHFSDARVVDTEGRLLREHRTAAFFAGGRVPQGFLFAEVLGRYFINPATMMYTRGLLDYLGGYDETLAYEDFDLQVRAAKKFGFCYSPEMLVEKRQVLGSLGHRQYRPGSAIPESTYRVCLKAIELCQTAADYRALAVRLRYERKMALLSLHWRVAWRMTRLLHRVRQRLTVAES